MQWSKCAFFNWCNRCISNRCYTNTMVYDKSLMISQRWFKWCLGLARQQAKLPSPMLIHVCVALCRPYDFISTTLFCHVLFADDSIVSLYNCNGREPHYSSFWWKTNGLFHWRTDGIRGHDTGLTIKYCLRPVLMVPVLGPVGQHAAAAAMIRNQS